MSREDWTMKTVFAEIILCIMNRVSSHLKSSFSFNPNLIDYLFKFLIIGSAGSGKSCLLHHFIENKCEYFRCHFLRTREYSRNEWRTPDWLRKSTYMFEPSLSKRTVSYCYLFGVLNAKRWNGCSGGGSRCSLLLLSGPNGIMFVCWLSDGSRRNTNWIN